MRLPVPLIGFTLALSPLLAAGSWAAPSMCGDPPPSVPVLEQDRSQINGEIDGQAKILQSLIGKGEFKGKADAYRNQIYRDPDKLRAALKEQRLFYVFCRTLEDSKDLSTAQKMDYIRTLQAPIPEAPGNTPAPQPDGRFKIFEIKIDGHAEIADEQILINVGGISTVPGRSGQGADVIVNGESTVMFPGERKAIKTDGGTCILQVVGINSVATTQFRTDCQMAVR